MLTIGDIYLFVSDFPRALRFWRDGLQLELVEQEQSAAAAFAVLEFPDGGPALRLLSGAAPWPEGERPEPGVQAGISFDVMTDEFDDLLVRLLEHGGSQAAEIESYNDLRVVTVADPDGNAFDLLEVMEE